MHAGMLLVCAKVCLNTNTQFLDKLFPVSLNVLWQFHLRNVLETHLMLSPQNDNQNEGK